MGQQGTTTAVVIPTRSDGIELKTCLALPARQTRPADEIIVVDNSSSDDTAAICAAAGVKRSIGRGGTSSLAHTSGLSASLRAVPRVYGSNFAVPRARGSSL